MGVDPRTVKGPGSSGSTEGLCGTEGSQQNFAAPPASLHSGRGKEMKKLRMRNAECGMKPPKILYDSSFCNPHSVLDGGVTDGLALQRNADFIPQSAIYISHLVEGDER